MATLMPSSNVEAAYEDMFKEITRKLYGEETGNGLHTLGTPVAQVATTGPTAPEGERSFTNLQIDRTSAPTIEYEHQTGAGGVATAAATAAAAAAGANVVIQQQPEGSVVVATTGGNFKSEDHLSTAFGLAALMQNGFATTGTILSTQAINKVVTNVAGQNTNIAGDQQQQRWSNDGSGTGADQQQQQQPQIVQWTTTGGKLQSYTTAQQQQQQQQQVTTPKSKSKNRNDQAVSTTTEVIYTSPSTSGNNAQQQQTTPTSTNANQSGGGSSGGNSRKKSNNSNSNNQQNNGGVQIQKRYACTHCPYSTDRRDLYTRHENIHKDEKPFQCYACLKQFNRADHVKKHFLRMHREMPYDINKTRRHVPSSSGGHHHSGGRGNITITTIHTPSTGGSSSGGSPEQKPNIFAASNVTLDNAFLEGQRQPTSSSLSIAETIEAVATAADAPLPQMKQEKMDDGMGGVVIVSSGGNGIGVSGGNVGNGNGGGNVKPKREKRFTCCYCPWSGADKWGLKRHLNTHTKPFVCLLCDYKAARSERLATHVLKVHNKRACNKCSFLADTQEEYQTHINEVHPHDNRPARNNSNNSNSNTNNNATNNLNVLRTIGNTLVTNNQLNTFQNAGTTFGVGNTTTTTTNAVGNAGGSVTIYTTTTTNDNGSGNIAGGPLQEIIVNPTSMVGWRLSANGSLIPPHDLLTGGLPNAAAQKRGSERLFQYLEADGSDPEDYARLLKMDAISRNTASVAQDFHKAGGVQELKLPANHQLVFNNKLPAHWTTKEAAALLQSLSNNNSNMSLALQAQQQRSKYNYQHQQHNGNGIVRQRQSSTGEDDENTPSSASSTNSSSDGITPVKLLQQQLYNERKQNVEVQSNGNEQRKAMSTFLSNNFELQQSAETTETTEKEIEMAANSSNLKRKYQQHVDEQQYDACKINNIYKDDNVHDENNINDEDQENKQEQLIKSPPAYKLNTNHNKTNNYNQIKTKSQQQHTRNAVNNIHQQQQHRLELIQQINNNSKDNKENATATFLTQMEYQNLNKIGTQFHNYVKDIINKYYTDETAPLMHPVQLPTPESSQQQSQEEALAKRKRMRSETEEYIEYLRNKEDITLTITPKVRATSTATATATTTNVASNMRTAHPKSPLKRQQDFSLLKTRQSPKKLTQQPITARNKPSRKSISHLATLLPLLADAASQQQYLAAPLDFSKKLTETQQQQINPPAIIETSSFIAPPPVIQPVDKRSSRKQAQPKKIRTPPEVIVAMLRDKYLNRMVDRKLSCAICANSATMLVFSYHTKGSLALHRLWKHRSRTQKCRKCGQTFKQRYSLGVHCRRVHQTGEKGRTLKKNLKPLK